MKSAIFALLISYWCGKITSQQSELAQIANSFSYQHYCLFCAFIFIAASYFLYQKLSFKKIERIEYFMIMVLCFCMSVSGFINVINSSPTIYYAIEPLIIGSGFTWTVIYQSTEIAILIMVIGNGLYNNFISPFYDWMRRTISNGHIINRNFALFQRIYV